MGTGHELQGERASTRKLARVRTKAKEEHWEAMSRFAVVRTRLVKRISSLFLSFVFPFLLHNDFYNLDLGGFTIFSSSSSTRHGLSYCA